MSSLLSYVWLSLKRGLGNYLRAEVLRRVRLDEVRFVGYAFQIEMKFRAWKYGFHITEVPIVFTDRTAGTSKMSGSIFFEAAFGVIRLKINSLFKKWK